MTFKKICLVGDIGVGKSSLARRFLYDSFEPRYRSTVGAKVNHRAVQLRKGSAAGHVDLLLWDLMSCDSYQGLCARYLHGCDGVIFVADATRPHSVLAIVTEAKRIRTIAPKAQLLFAANKSDMPMREESATLIAQFSESFGVGVYLTSAKTGANVDRLFHDLLSQLLAEDEKGAARKSKAKPFAIAVPHFEALLPPCARFGLGTQPWPWALQRRVSETALPADKQATSMQA
ncbi:MAG: GTP-binding protein [Anaerolineales bacterium]|nr:GTP-binding protein [Anaerolineales bacterium]MCB9126710.1 GTP-binding protein [Ardenticatenales bacterium]MCB9171748.1 GTP-binding protein [Ardenticatenales bacterium]